MDTEVLTSLVAILCAIAIIVYRYFIKKYNLKETGLPSVRSSFPFGSWNGLWGTVIGEVDLKNARTHRKLYWTFDGTTPNLFVADPNLISVILSDEKENFTSHRAARVSQPELKKSLEIIEDSRSGGNEVFKSVKTSRLAPRVQRSAESFVHSMQNKEANNSVYMQPCVMQYIGDVIAMSIFGMDLNSSELKSERSRFMEFVNRIFKVDNATSMTSVLPYAYPTWKTLDNIIMPEDALQYFVDLCMSVIEKKKELLDTPAEGIEARAVDLLDLLLEATNSKKDMKPEAYVEEMSPESNLTEEDIVCHVLSVILYSVRSAEGALSQSVHVLSNNPDEQTKLRDELVKLSQSSSDYMLESNQLSMFLKEIKRLYPSEFRLVRDSCKETKIGDVTIQPGTSVTVPVYAIHRLEEYYPDPLTFSSDRFETEKVLKRTKMSYLPLGQASSNESFIGVPFEDMIVKMGLTQFLLSYKVVPPSLEFQAPLDFAKGATEVPVTMPVFIQLEKYF